MLPFHAVTPVFGQGANSALESVRVLDAALTGAVDPGSGKVRAPPSLWQWRSCWTPDDTYCL